MRDDVPRAGSGTATTRTPACARAFADEASAAAHRLRRPALGDGALPARRGARRRRPRPRSAGARWSGSRRHLRVASRVIGPGALPWPSAATRGATRPDADWSRRPGWTAGRRGRSWRRLRRHPWSSRLDRRLLSSYNSAGFSSTSDQGSPEAGEQPSARRQRGRLDRESRRGQTADTRHPCQAAPLQRGKNRRLHARATRI